MTFDASSARVVEEPSIELSRRAVLGGFDPESATLVEGSSFDPASATPFQPKTSRPLLERAAIAAEPVVVPTLNVLADVGRGYPLIEAGANVLTGMAAMPLAGLAGLAAGGSADVVGRVANALTYQPRSEGGKRLAAGAMYPFELLAEGADVAGEAVRERTGSPLAATAVNTAIQSAPMGLGVRRSQPTPRPAPASIADQMQAIRPLGEKPPFDPGSAKAVSPEAAPPGTTLPAETVTKTAGAQFDTASAKPVGEVPTFQPTRGDAPEVPRHAVQGVPVAEIPLANLRLSKDVPQFKAGADDKGIVTPLGGKFDRRGVAPIQVWERADGAQEVISGRHRLDLARRSGEETLPAQVYREADGFTKEQAVVLDAELNIRDEQGSVADYANYFRTTGITEAQAIERGLVARAKGRAGYQIATSASDDLFAAHSAGLLSDEAARAISETAPGNAAVQAVGLRLVNEGKSTTLATNTMQAVQALARERPPEQRDIFGFDDSAMQQAIEMARSASSEQRAIREQVAAVSGASKRPEIAAKFGVDVKDPEGIRLRIDELRAEQDRWNNWALHPDLVARLRGDASKFDPESAKPLELKSQTNAEILAAEQAEKTATTDRNRLATEAEQKAAADRQLNDFGLSGSDRQADFNPYQKDILDLNVGITPKAAIEGAKSIAADLAKTKFGIAAKALGDDLQMKTAPMAQGSTTAQALAKDYANAERLSRWQFSRFDQILTKSFTREERAAMWNAADEHNTLLQLGEDAAGRGLDRLTQDQRTAVDVMHAHAEELLQRAKDVGMFEGDGLPYWTPRMAALIGADGTITRPPSRGPESGSAKDGRNVTATASSLKHRKYLTVEETEAAMKGALGETAQVVRDIRTMPLAMARLERAIAGRELVNAIKEIGKKNGEDLVANAPKHGFFTLDHPAFKNYRYRQDIAMREAWDKLMWQGLLDFAADIGVKPERLATMRGRRWGDASPSGQTRTRFGGPETVLTHELGHQLDFKYGLVEKFFGGKAPLSDFIIKRQIAKGEREGNSARVAEREKQMAINSEMRALADLRYEGTDPAQVVPNFKRYVRIGTEKIANMVHAYVHAPDKFKEVAPTAFAEFNRFIDAHPELSRLRTIKPSLVLEAGGFKKRPPGDDFDISPVYIRKDFEGPLKSIMQQPQGAAYNALMQLKMRAMSVIMYSPIIHNAVEFGRALPVMPGKVATLKIYFEGNKVKNDPVQMRQAISEGMVPIGNRFAMQDVTGIAEEPGLALQAGRSWTAKVIAAPIEMVSPKAAESVRKGVDIAGDFWHNTLLWDRIGDLQAGIYSNMRANMIERGMEEGAAGKVAAHFANRYAGALPNESMSASARKIANLTLFSRSFTLGNLGVMKDMINGLPRDVRAQLERDYGALTTATATKLSRRKAVGAFVLDIGLLYVGNSLLQDALDAMKRDKTLDAIAQDYVERLEHLLARAKESPLELLNSLDHLSSTSTNEPGKQERVLYEYDESGTGIYVRFPTGKIGEEFKGWIASPLDMLKRKESTFARPAIQTLTNDMGFGRELYDATAPFFSAETVKSVGKIVGNFMAAQTPKDMVKSAWDLLQGKGDKTDLYKVVGPIFGITFSKGAPGGPAVGEMFTEERKHRSQVAAVMPDVKRLIKHGDVEQAIVTMQNANMMPREIGITLRYLEAPTARLSPRRLREFYSHAPEESQQRMQRFLEDRK